MHDPVDEIIRVSIKQTDYLQREIHSLYAQRRMEYAPTYRVRTLDTNSHEHREHLRHKALQKIIIETLIGPSATLEHRTV